MKIIVTHASPDWDAIGSVWILKKYLPGWAEATVEFVPAGQRLERLGNKRLAPHFPESQSDPIEIVGEDEVIHVDTGMGPLDHHQTGDKTLSGAGLSWSYIKRLASEGKVKLGEGEKLKEREEAIDRVMAFIVETDHFGEVFWPDAAADRHEFTILGVLEGLKLLKPNQDEFYVQWGREILDSLMHAFENRVWAEREIKTSGHEFETRWGKALGFETINDTVLKLAQKMGYTLVVRKDPRKGYVRIKARPTEETGDKQKAKNYSSSEGVEGESRRNNIAMQQSNNGDQGSRPASRQGGQARTIKTSEDIDLTLVYEKLSKIDPQATWFLHASKKMLLNGTPKNPKMIPTKLTLDQIIDVLKGI